MLKRGSSLRKCRPHSVPIKELILQSPPASSSSPHRRAESPRLNPPRTPQGSATPLIQVASGIQRLRVGLGLKLPWCSPKMVLGTHTSTDSMLFSTFLGEVLQIECSNVSTLISHEHSLSIHIPSDFEVSGHSLNLFNVYLEGPTT